MGHQTHPLIIEVFEVADARAYGYRMRFANVPHHHQIRTGFLSVAEAVRAADHYNEREWRDPPPNADPDVRKVSLAWREGTIGWRDENFGQMRPSVLRSRSQPPDKDC